MLMLLSSLHAARACSPPDVIDVFQPNPMEWQRHPGPGQEGETGDYWEKIPAPIVEIVEIDRGTGSDGSSCEDMGILTITVALPEQSTYSVGEFAAYFRVQRGDDPDEIFPAGPLTGLARADVTYFQFFWLDGAPPEQRPLDLDVEVFLVAKDLSIGPPTVVTVKSP